MPDRERIVNSAHFANKIPCPNCERGREIKFYDGEVGVVQHFLIKHVGAFSKEKHMGRLMNFLHGQETAALASQFP